METATHESTSRKGMHGKILCDLKRAQSLVHNRIVAVQAVAPDDATFCEATCDLQDEYNDLYDAIDREGTPFSPYADPLEALPVEIWTQIILDASYTPATFRLPAIETLFLLTLVSKSWFHKLVSNALLWADIRLIETVDDYAAKAQICLHLSKTSQLRIESRLSRERWLEFQPWLLPHADRIVKLVQHDTDILGELLFLPSLRHLSSSLDITHEEQRIELVDPGRIPLLETFEKYPMSVKATSPWFPYIMGLSYESPELPEEEVRAWHRARNLRNLDVRETQAAQSHYVGPTNLRNLSIEQLRYFGPNLRRALSWIGPTLTELEVSCNGPSQLWDIAHAVANATSLKGLRIYATLDGGEFPDSGEYAVKPLPISQTSLILARLRFASYNYSGISEAWSRSLHQILPSTFPRVYDLTITVSHMTLPLLRYIEGLSMLRHADIHYMRLDNVKDAMLRVSSALLSARWNRVSGALGIFDFPVETYDTLHLLLRVTLTRDEIIEGEGQAILPLSFGQVFGFNDSPMVGLLDAKKGARWRYSIQNLEFPRMGDVFLNDFIESLVLHPSRHPKLEQIHCAAIVVEWDILILMLERRNLSGGHEKRRISEFMLDNLTPEHLRLVIERLLSGKYPSRLALSEYSLEAVGRHMFDSERTGCMRCCHLLRKCDTPVKALSTEPSNTSSSYEITYDQLAKNYVLPHKYMVANPPLSHREATWIAGKQERRQTFSQGFKESLTRFRRENSCTRPYVFSSGVMKIECYHQED